MSSSGLSLQGVSFRSWSSISSRMARRSDALRSPGWKVASAHRTLRLVLSRLRSKSQVISAPFHNAGGGLACRLQRQAAVNRAPPRRVSPLRARIPHACALRLPDTRMERKVWRSETEAGAGVTVPYVQDYYLWSLLKRLDSTAASVVSQASGSDVALNITHALHRKKAATKLDSITANTVVVYI